MDDVPLQADTVDFTPAFSHGAIAKIMSASCSACAALTVLSLLWMAIRVRRRGGYGRKSSAVLRSLYPVVLGLGGWLLGVLVVLTTMPGVALDDGLLALLSVGVPVGLGIFLAWVRTDPPSPSNVAGLAAAVAGVAHRRLARIPRGPPTWRRSSPPSSARSPART